MRPKLALLAPALLALLPALLLGACGGKVVVDAPSGATGVGGAGGAGGQGQGGALDTGVGGQNTGAACGPCSSASTTWRGSAAMSGLKNLPNGVFASSSR